MRVVSFLAIALSLLLLSCNSKPSMQKYFVDHQEKPGFMVVDISPSILNVDKTKLTSEQSNALASFHKMNILAYKFECQKIKLNLMLKVKKVNEILKDTVNYQQLMKFGSGKRWSFNKFYW